MEQLSMRKFIIGSVVWGMAIIGMRSDVIQRQGTQQLVWSPDGCLKAYHVGKESLLAKAVYPFAALDAKTGKTAYFTGAVSQTAAGILLTAEAPVLQLGLKVHIKRSADTPFFIIDAEVENRSADRERAIELQFALPLRKDQWNFNSDEIDVQNGAISALPDTAYEELRILVNPRFEMPMSRLPFLAVDNGETGIMLGHPLAQPRFFRYVFQTGTAGSGILKMRVPLGISTDTAKFPGRAGVTFFLGEFDAATHFRGALQQYYRHAPDHFRTHIGYPGAWGLWIQPETMALAGKCGIGFNQREWDLDFSNDPIDALHILRETHRHDLKAMMYAEPWGVFLPFPKNWLQEHKDSSVVMYYDQAPVDAAALKTYVESFRHDLSPTERFPGDLTNDDLYRILQNTAIEINPAGDWRLNCYWPGRFEWGQQRFGDDYGMIIVNSDPELTLPNRQTITFEKARYGFIERCLNGSGEKMDGYYIDSEAYAAGWSECNFRRDHWTVADLPLTYARFPEDGKIHVFQHMALAHNDFLRDIRRRADQSGRCIGSNTWPFAAFLIPYVDFLGCGEFFNKDALPSLADFREFRFLAGQKVVTTMDYVLNFEGNVPVSAEGVEQYMEPRLNMYLQYGIFPGSGNAGDSPEKYELLVPVMEPYAKAIEAINQAGWQANTRSEVTGDGASGILVERWGTDPANGLYFTLRNRGKKTAVIQLRFQPANRAEKKVEIAGAVELLSGATLPVAAEHGVWTIPLEIAPERTILIQCVDENERVLTLK